MGRYGNPNYPRLVKLGMLTSFLLVVVGVVGTSAGRGRLPGWELSLLFDAEVFGVLGLLLCPFVFGILMPLTE